VWDGKWTSFGDIWMNSVLSPKHKHKLLLNWNPVAAGVTVHDYLGNGVFHDTRSRLFLAYLYSFDLLSSEQMEESILGLYLNALRPPAVVEGEFILRTTYRTVYSMYMSFFLDCNAVDSPPASGLLRIVVSVVSPP
jgi:hypothetical protein